MIVQDAYYIPNDLATGLSTGVYQRMGSIIRYAWGPNRGRIVKHLKPIDLKSTEGTMNWSGKAVQFVEDHKKECLWAAIGIGIGIIGAVGGAVIYKRHKTTNSEPKVVVEFKAAFRDYIEAVREGNMDVGKIDKLMTALDKLKQNEDFEKINIQLTADELQVTVDRLYEYTVKLAKDNNVELSDEDLNASIMNESGAISNLQNYLKAQKKVFDLAA